MRWSRSQPVQASLHRSISIPPPPQPPTCHMAPSAPPPCCCRGREHTCWAAQYSTVQHTREHMLGNAAPQEEACQLTLNFFEKTRTGHSARAWRRWLTQKEATAQHSCGTGKHGHTVTLLLRCAVPTALLRRVPTLQNAPGIDHRVARRQQRLPTRDAKCCPKADNVYAYKHTMQERLRHLPLGAAPQQHPSSSCKQ